MTDVRLEPLGASHLAGIRALVADPSVRRFTRIPEPPPPEFAEQWLERYDHGRRDGSREGFAIVGGDGAFLGLALVARFDRDTSTAELGYVVAESARGRGVATAALRLLTRHAIEQLGAHRIELLISVANEPSKRVAERAGYLREGVLRSVFLKPGVREHTEIWSRLATDA